METAFYLRLLEIIWINILLSGDNAVVIALACRSLPPHLQKWGVILGTVPAVVLRVLFTVIISYLLAIPYLKAIGGLALIWVAISLLRQQDEDEAHISDSANLWHAIRTIVVADIVMSLDNVIAIAAAAKGDLTLLVIGLLMSMPLVIFGSTLLLRLLTKFPVLITVGGALLGYIAGEVIVEDPALEPWVPFDNAVLVDTVPLLLAGGVVVLAKILDQRAARVAQGGPSKDPEDGSR